MRKNGPQGCIIHNNNKGHSLSKLYVATTGWWLPYLAVLGPVQCGQQPPQASSGNCCQLCEKLAGWVGGSVTMVTTLT